MPARQRFMESLDAFFARIGTMNRGGFVAQAFEPAGSGDFPVARSWSTGLESPVNPQAGKPAVQAGSWREEALDACLFAGLAVNVPFMKSFLRWTLLLVLSLAPVPSVVAREKSGVDVILWFDTEDYLLPAD